MKILITDTMHIGDILFATPFLRGLRRAYPDADITMIVTDACADVVRFNPNINHLMPINRKKYHSNFFNIFKLCKSLRRENYDMVINLHGVEWISIIALFATNKLRCGFSAAGFRSFFDLPIILQKDIHMIKNYCNILTALGKDTFLDDKGMEMYADAVVEEKVNNLWESLNIPTDRPIIGVNPGGTWETKKWTTSGFAQLIELINNEGMTPVIFGGPTDIVMVDEILQQTSVKPVVLTGRLSLLELSVALRHCNVLVSGDSGPMHIAASQNVPVVAIFGPSDTRRYAPFGVRNEIIKADFDCIPCNKRECPTIHCMTSISAEKVFHAVKSIISEKILVNMIDNENS